MGYFVVSDIHGNIEKFQKILEHWNIQEDILVCLGDYVDRGEDSLKVIRLLMDLKDKYPTRTIFLMGNHDEFLIDFVRSKTADEIYHNYRPYLADTFRSAFKELGDELIWDLEYIHKYLNENFKNEIDFLENLGTLFEAENCIFVHAGLNLDLEDWQDTPKEDRLWLREKFYLHKDKAPKRTYFGHTYTLTVNQPNNVWVSEDGSKVCIDGGASYGYVLNGVKVNDDGDIVEIVCT